MANEIALDGKRIRELAVTTRAASKRARERQRKLEKLKADGKTEIIDPISKVRTPIDEEIQREKSLADLLSKNARMSDKVADAILGPTEKRS